MTNCGECGAKPGFCGCWHERPDEHAPALWRSPLGTLDGDGKPVVAWQPVLLVGDLQGIPVFETAGRWRHDEPEKAVSDVRRRRARGPQLRGKSWRECKPRAK